MTAIDALVARLRLHPSDAAAAEELARTALETESEDSALPLVIAAAGYHRDNPRLWQWVGLLHRSLGEHDLALPAFDRAAAIAPGDIRIAQGRAQVALEAGLDAVGLFETAIALEPNNGEMLLSRAAARVAIGDSERAVAEIEALIAQHPGWYAGHDRLIQIRWMMGDRERATELVDRTATANPADLNLWRVLILALIAAGRHEAALDAIRRGRVTLGEQLIFTANEATALSEMGAPAEADRLFEMLTGANDLSIAIRHVRHQLRTGRVDGALPIIERWLSPHGDRRGMWPYAAAAWRLSGDRRSTWLEDDPAFVRVIDLADRISDIDHLSTVLRGLHRAKGQHLDQSVRGGTQTDGPLFSRIEPEIRALRALILDAVADHVARLPDPDPRHPLLAYGRPARPRFAGSWSVRLAGEGHHANHVHPAGWISSAFYLTVPDEVGTGGSEGWLTLGAPQAELGLAIEPYRRIDPRPGRLVLFPSTMWHGTLPFRTGERLTVAFDIALPSR
ncbi:MAG: putative 2OG-Fe(II) oxygenase [Pseudomonadota bacterium]